MVEILVSLWNGPFSGAMLVSGRVTSVFFTCQLFPVFLSMFHPKKTGERILGPFLGICHGMWHLCDLANGGKFGGDPDPKIATPKFGGDLFSGP